MRSRIAVAVSVQAAYALCYPAMASANMMWPSWYLLSAEGGRLAGVTALLAGISAAVGVVILRRVRRASSRDEESRPC